MPRHLHAHVFAVLTDDTEPVSETFSTEVSKEEPEQAALALAAFLRELAAAVEQGVRD